jgi:hypothetical protein
MDTREEVRVAWGTGIAGYVAETGEPVNIKDAYQVKFVKVLWRGFFIILLLQEKGKKNTNLKNRKVSF